MTLSPRLRQLMLLAGLVLSLLGFEEVADDVFRDVPEGDLEAVLLDERVAAWFRGIRSPAMTQAMTDLTALGSVSVLLLVAVAVAGLLVMLRRWQGVFQVLVLGVGAGLIPALLKRLFDRPRPELADHLARVTDLSFPSGHTFGATAIYLFLLLYALRHIPGWPARLGWAAFAGLLVALVAVSRLYLGVHHATDVLGGLAAGAAWAFAVALATEVYASHGIRQKKRGQQLPPRKAGP